MNDIVDEMVSRHAQEIRASHTIGEDGSQPRTRPVPYDDIRDKLLELPHVHDGYVTSDIFTERHALLKELDPQPETVFEFGCLRAYFLVTALDACPSIRQVGWVDNESHTVSSNQQALHNIFGYWKRHRIGPEPSVWWEKNAWQSADFGECDVVSVDGDHSYEGCLTDLVWARRMQPRVILVDDYVAHMSVQEATKHFVALYGWSLEYRNTVNGLALLTPPA